MAVSITVHLEIFKRPQLPYFSTDSDETGINVHDLSLLVRKPSFCICENKDADQLRGNREADQRLCIRYIDSIIPILSKSEILSL